MNHRPYMRSFRQIQESISFQKSDVSNEDIRDIILKFTKYPISLDQNLMLRDEIKDYVTRKNLKNYDYTDLLSRLNGATNLFGPYAARINFETSPTARKLGIKGFSETMPQNRRDIWSNVIDYLDMHPKFKSELESRLLQEIIDDDPTASSIFAYRPNYKFHIAHTYYPDGDPVKANHKRTEYDIDEDNLLRSGLNKEINRKRKLSFMDEDYDTRNPYREP